MNKSAKLLTDEDLIQGLKDESNDAFEFAYRTYYSMIESFVLKNSGSQNDAKDLFQDVLVILVRNIRKPSFRLNQETKLSTYLYAIARNVWLAKLKKDRKSNVVSFDELKGASKLSAGNDAFEKSEFELKHQLISKTLTQLGEECKKIVTDFYFKKVKLKILADEMGYTQNFIRQKKMRCMQQLQKKCVADPEYHSIENKK